MIKYDYSLKEYNTLNLDVNTKVFVEFETVEDLRIINNKFNFNNVNWMVLSGGSNTFFKSNFNGLILHPASKKISTIRETQNEVVIKVCAGVKWSSFIRFTNKNKYSGVESLTSIPGFVGSAPKQNIGAYGREVSEVIEEVLTYDPKNDKLVLFNKEQCGFSYRTSIFKKEEYKNHIILEVSFRLKKHKKRLNVSTLKDFIKLNSLLLSSINFKISLKKPVSINHSEIRKILDLKNISPQIKSYLVAQIRKKVMPNYKFHGNVGSFFKSPIISKSHLDELIIKYPTIEYYVNDSNSVKISAAWLIRQTNLFLKKEPKNVSIYTKRPGIILNLFNQATGSEIENYACLLEKEVETKIGIRLEREVVTV
jgi:UDP-N-acetylmuramate dehydrogenase